MEELALGEMMMTVGELNDILPNALFNKIRGYNNKMRQEWERTRMATYLGLSPYMPKEKAPTLYEVFPFPWDGDVKHEMLQKVKVDAEEARKKRQDTWAKVDEIKKIRSVSSSNVTSSAVEMASENKDR